MLGNASTANPRRQSLTDSSACRMIRAVCCSCGLNEGQSRQVLVKALDRSGRAPSPTGWRISASRLPPASVIEPLSAAQPYSSGCSGSRVAVESSNGIGPFRVVQHEYGGAACEHCVTDLAFRAYSITDFHHTALLHGHPMAKQVMRRTQSRLSFLAVHANLMLFYEGA